MGRDAGERANGIDERQRRGADDEKYKTYFGLWCNFYAEAVLGRIAFRLSQSFGYAARAACQITGIVAVGPPNLPTLYLLREFRRVVLDPPQIVVCAKPTPRSRIIATRSR